VTFTGLKEYKASAEYGFVAIDQAEEVEERIIRLLRGRVRQRLPDGRFPRFRMFLTCNPHPNIEWFLAEKEHSPDEFAFVPSLPSDNPYLPSDFFRTRKAAYTDDQYQRLIEGSWDVFAGQAISEFDRNIHVIPPFDTWRKDKWPVHRGIDYGTSNPTVCEWVAVSHDNDIFFVQEYERANEVVSANAKAIAAMSLDMRLAQSWIDPRTSNPLDLNNPSKWSIQDEYQKQGVYTQLSRDTRENRLAAWKQGLKLDANRRNPRTMETPAPRVYICSNCTRLIWELPRLQYRDAISGYADDVIKAEDHAYDAGGFVLSNIIGKEIGGKQRENVVGMVKK